VSLVILAIDIGNTSTACAVFRGRSIVFRHHVPTPRRWTAGRLLTLLRPTWAGRIGTVEVSSVVPAHNRGVADDCRKILGREAHFLDYRGAGGIAFKIGRPSALGADRIAGCLGALRLLPPPVIVIDAGTAITFDLVNAEKEYCGGCILPGIDVAIRGLADHTARLKSVAFAVPASPVGTSTAQCIRAGVFFGAIGTLTHLIGVYRAILGPSSRVVATGGQMRHFRGRVPGIDRFEPDLLFFGLKSAAEQRAHP
jgi:type III pantothenate kinase